MFLVMLVSHSVSFRVRIVETDFDGVAYYGSYFIYFDHARSDFMRKIGYSFSKLKSMGIETRIVSAHCDYKAPLKYEDIVEVNIRLAKIGNTSIRFEYEIYRVDDVKQKTLCAVGYTVHVFVNGNGRPTPPPDWLRKTLEEYLS